MTTIFFIFYHSLYQLVYQYITDNVMFVSIQRYEF